MLCIGLASPGFLIGCGRNHSVKNLAGSAPLPLPNASDQAAIEHNSVLFTQAWITKNYPEVFSLMYPGATVADVQHRQHWTKFLSIQRIRHEEIPASSKVCGIKFIQPPLATVNKIMLLCLDPTILNSTAPNRLPIVGNTAVIQLDINGNIYYQIWLRGHGSGWRAVNLPLDLDQATYVGISTWGNS